MNIFTKRLLLMALLCIPWATLVKAQCDPGVPSCNISFQMTDSYGDGWNGCTISVYQGSNLRSTVTLNSGSSGETTVAICTDDSVRLVWYGESGYPNYSTEAGFTVVNGDGTTVIANQTGSNYSSNSDIITFMPACPSCIAPSSLTATSITTDGFTLSWIDNNSNSTFNIDYWKNGGDTTTVTTTATSYTFTGLDANSNYNFAVTAICSASDQSTALTGSFATACGGSTCDMTLELGSTDSWADPFTYYSGPASVELFQGGRSLGSYSSTTTVEVCSTDPIVVKYNHSGYSWSDYYDNAASIIVRDGGGVAVYQGGMGDTLCVVNTPCPSCIPPMDLTAEAEMDEITFSWTPRSGASQFIVFLNGEVESDNVTDTFYTFTGLNANTQYTLGVQSVCSSDDSSSIVSISTRTTCGEIALPFSDDFDSYDNGFWPPCWHRLIKHGTDPSVNSQYQSSGSQSMFLLAENDTNFFVTPSAIPTSGDNIYVRYKAYCDYSPYSTPNPWWIKVGVMTDTSDVSTFIMLDSIGYHNCNNAFEEHEFNTSALNPNATYWVAWMFTSSNSSLRGAIDDVFIDEIPSCLRATDATVANVTAHTADLSWDDMGVDSYNIYYGTVNDINDDDISMVSTFDTAITLTGLSGETHYYAWVASVCSGNEAEANAFNSFTTLISCPAVTGLSIDTAYSDGAVIVWNAGGNETEWAVVLDSNDIEIVNDTFYVADGLNAMTGHTLYVCAVCNDEDTSATASINFATTCEDATCNFTVDMTDSYGDGWNGNSIEFYQAGILIGSATITGGSSGTETVEVCSSASVELRFHKGSFSEEMGGSVADGSGATVFTISGMNSLSNNALLTTVDIPCPDCIMPMHVYLDTTSLTSTSATIYWEAGNGSAWIVLIDSTYDNVTDTFYTFNNLNPRTTYTVYVATDCSGEASTFKSFSFTTECANGSCDITVTSTNDGSYVSSYYSPTLKVYQNGEQLASVCADTRTVNVCSGMPVAVIYQDPDYFYYTPQASISDGVGTELFNGSTSNYNTGDTIVAVANPCPTCMPVTGLVVSAVDSVSITYSWDIVNGNSYYVSFDGSAFVDNSNGSFTATGLTPNTEHLFQIMTVCDVDDTSAIKSLTTRTTCLMMTLPYTENFDSYNNGVMPTCWNVLHDYTYNDFYSGSTTYPSVGGEGYFSSHGLTFLSDGPCMASTSAIPNNGWMGDQYHISFFAKMGSYASATAGVLTNPFYDSTYTVLANITNDGEWHRYDLYTSGMVSSETYYFAVRYDGTYAYDEYALHIDSLLIEIDSGCHYPSNLSVTTTINSATLQWSNDGTVSNFVVAYKTSNADTYNYANAGSADSLVINNLQSSSTYDFRIGNICNNGDTLWSDVSGTTECGVIYLPYFEDFSAFAQDVLPPCWIYNASGITHFDGGLFFKSNTGPGYPAVMPQFDQPISKTEIDFDAKLGPISEGDAILVGVADASGTFIQWLDTLTNTNQSRSQFVFMSYRFDTYSGNGARIALGRLYTGSDWALIDNINVRQIPTCSPAENITGHNLFNPDSSYFTWSNPDSLTQFQIYVDTVTADTTTIPINTLSSITGYNYLIPTGILTGGGKYKFFIRTDCGNDFSPWKEVVFGSGEFVMSQSGTDTLTSCGLVIYDNGGPYAGYYSQTSSSLVIYPAGTGNRLQVYGAYLSFYNDGNSTLTIYDGVGTNGNILYQTSYSGPTTLYDSIVSLPLATASNGPLTVSFSAGFYVNPGFELYIRCIPIVACDDPTYIQATSITESSASLSWYGNAGNYNIYYRPYGNSSWNMTTSTSANVTLTGLTSSTTYEVQIRAICSDNDSSNLSSIFSFTTECDIVNIAQGMTLVEDFEGIQVPPTCWQLVYGANGNANDNPVIYDASAAYSGAKGLRFSSANTTASGNYNQTLITPELNSADSMSVIFYVRASEGSETFRVGYSTTGSEAANFNWRPNVTIGTSWTHYRADIPANAKYVAINYFAATPNHHLYVDSLVVTLNDGSVDCQAPAISSTSATATTISVNYSSLTSVQAGIVEGDTWDDATIAQNIPDGTSFTFDHLFSDNSALADSTTYTIGLRAICGSDYSEWVTVSVTTLQMLCNDPTDLTVVSVDATSASLTWNGNGASSWEVNYSDGTNENTITTSTNSVTLSGLTTGVTYTARVRSNCGQNHGEWSDIVTFIPSNCPIPMELSTSNISSHSATIRWNEGEESEWEVAYGLTSSFNIEYATHVTVNTNVYTITGLTPGQNYTWTVRTICGNSDRSGWSSHINFSTSQNPDGIDNVENSTVSIYPNPTSDNVTISLNGISGDVNVTIVDLNGRIVKEMSASCGDGDCTTRMDVSNLVQGAYFVRIASGNGLDVVKKLVVN